MAKAPFIGGFNAADAVQSANERSINLMPEPIAGKADWRLAPTPGLRELCTLPYQTRGPGFEASNGRVFQAAGQYLYELFADGSFNGIGLLNAETTPVSMDDNGIQLVIVDGVAGWVLEFETGIFTKITSVGFLGSNKVIVADGYAMMFKEGSQTFFHSDLYDALVYDPVDEASVESNPDKIQTFVLDGSGVLMLGTRSIETYWNTGDINQVFQRRQGSVIRYGCVAPRSVCAVNDGIMWIGRDQNGQGSLYRMAGVMPTKKSSIALDQALQAAPALNDAVGFAYEQGGHAFYGINIPGIDTTFVYDFLTDFWHERRSFDESGFWGRWRVEHTFTGFGLNLANDHESGRVYVVDPCHNWDHDKIMKFRRELTPIYDRESYRDITYNEFRIDANVGNCDVNPPYDDLQVGMYVSDDGGKTFGSVRLKPIGKIGEYKTDIAWRRCGASKNRVFRVEFVGPYAFAINNAFVDVTMGR